MKLPCNNLIGETSKCNDVDVRKELFGSAKHHTPWSKIELGMMEKFESSHDSDIFRRNTLNRLKAESSHFFGDSVIQKKKKIL